MIRVDRFVLLRRLCVAATIAFTMSGVFAEEFTPGADDVACTVVGGETKYYTSLDTLFAEITNDTEVVVFKACTFSSAVSVTNAVNFYSETLPGCEIQLSKAAKFEIHKEASLNISSLRFRREKADSAPFVISGGTLELGDGAEILELLMSNRGNAVRVEFGTFRMLDGSAIAGCEASTRCIGLGGAVYLAGAESNFEFFGGAISGCSSRDSGGAVYAAKGAKVAIKASAKAFGNTAESNAGAGDLFFAESAGMPLLSVVGKLTGEVGVYYTGRTGAADSFAVVDASVDASAVCSKVKNTADNSLYAAASADGKTLVWTEAPLVDDTPKPLPDSNGAEAKVVNGLSVKYYAKVADALEVAVDAERVELLKDAALDDSVEIPSKIVFDGCGFTLSRSGKFLINVGDSALSLTNIVLDGADHPGRFLNVRTGSLVFESGTTLRNVNGNASDFVAPIVVWG
jgi:hypothetical protein